MDEVHSGTSVMSQSDLRLPLWRRSGKENRLPRSEMANYPEGEVFTDLDPNQILVIKEGSGIVQKIKPNLKTSGRN